MEVILWLTVGIIIGIAYKSFFGNDALDEAEARNVELAKQLKEVSDENKELKELRRQAINNNTKILNVNRKQEKCIKAITELTEINTYNNEKAILNRIKELVHDYQSQN